MGLHTVNSLQGITQSKFITWHDTVNLLHDMTTICNLFHGITHCKFIITWHVTLQIKHGMPL